MKIKAKGAFEYQHGLDISGGGMWWKNQSCKIIPIAVEKYMINGTPIEQTVMQCDDPFRFMHTLKVQRSDAVYLGGKLTEYEDTLSPPDAKGRHPKRKQHLGGTSQQRVGRYYVTRNGAPLWKIMAPLKKLPHHKRPRAIEKGHLVTMCNDLHDFDWNRLDRLYYITKAKELVAETGFDKAR